jgi:hypothetical protein
VEAKQAMEKNFLHTNDTKKIHPRLLIYAKKGINQVLASLQDYVTKGGQLRSLGDAAFETAETPEHYDEAKQYYEEAIAHDESLRSVLQEKLDSLDQIERNQKAQSYENQADQSLGKKRFKEACDLYKLAMRSAVVNSHIYIRIREKEDYMMRIISLEIANHLTEKGEECLKSGLYAQSRENFAQALKLNPTYVHLTSIISGIDKVITAQSSAQKVSEANQAMKVGRYKCANQLFLEAVQLVPEREAALKNVLESLVVLMQGEDALMKQRSGLMALEDKKYAQAIQLITEAIGLLPGESITEHAFFLCDRAQVYFEMKEYQTSIEDCHAALELRPELAIAYFRLGSAQFELEQYDEALLSYEKALRIDPSLCDQVKVKVRQVNTAKEIQQRKEREADRSRTKEEERKRLEEKRVREEEKRKERQEKLAAEQAEKAERLLMHKEEKLMMVLLNRVQEGTGGKGKEKAKELVKKDKKDSSQRAAEKEKAKADKEREKERVKAEKEAKQREEQELKDAELQRQRDFAAEMEKAAAKLREADRERELERERVRQENERIIAEREKARQEKAAAVEAKKPKGESKVEKASRDESSAATPAEGKSKGKKAVPVPVEFPVLSQQIKTAEASGAAAAAKSAHAPATAAPAASTGAAKGVIPAKTSTVRSSSTPVAAVTNWASLLVPEEPVLPKPTPVASSKSLATPAEEFPPLHDQPALAQTLPEPMPVAPTSSKKPLVPMRTASEPPLIMYMPSSGEAKAAQSPHLLQAQPSDSMMPALAAAGYAGTYGDYIPPSNGTAWDSLSTVQTAPALHAEPAMTARDPPPPGIRPISPRSEQDLLSSSGSYYNLALGCGSEQSDLLSLLKDSSTPAAALPLPSPLPLGAFQPFSLSCNPSNALDSALSDAAYGSNSSLGNIGSSRGFSDSAFSGLGLGPISSLSAIDSNADANSSRLSYLFSNSNSSMHTSHQGMGADSLLLGADSSLGLLSSFGLGGDALASSAGASSGHALGFFHMDVPLDTNGSSSSVSPLFLGSSRGLLGDADASQHSQLSRLDKILGLGGNGSAGHSLDTSSSRLFPDSSSTPGRVVSNGGSSFQLADSGILSGLGAGLWMQPGSSSTSSNPANASFSLSSLLPSSPPRRLELSELGKRPEDEVLGEAAFPSIAWLRALGMLMFRWALHGSEWAEYALSLPRALLPLFGDVRAVVGEIARRTGCDMKLVDVLLAGQAEMAIVFVRGTVGSISNRTMDQALDLLSLFLQQQQSQMQTHTQLLYPAGLVAPVPLPVPLPPAPASNRWNSPPLSLYEAGKMDTTTASAAAAGAAVTAPSGFAATDSMLDALIAGSLRAPTPPLEDKAKTSPPLAPLTSAALKAAERPPLLKLAAHPSGQVRRHVEIPSELIGLVIGAGGKKIKELATESGCRVQFKTAKLGEKEGRPGMLELHGAAEAVDRAMAMVWELVQSVGKEYKEVSAQQARR